MERWQPVKRRDQSTSPRAHEPTSPRAHEPTSPRAHEPTSPRAHEPTSPRAHEPTSPRVHESTSPRVHESTSPRVHESTSPRSSPPDPDSHLKISVSNLRSSIRAVGGGTRPVSCAPGLRRQPPRAGHGASHRPQAGHAFTPPLAQARSGLPSSNLRWQPALEHQGCGWWHETGEHPRVHESTRPRVHASTSPRVREPTRPRVHESTSPRVHASTSPRVHASTRPRVHASTSPRVHASTRPRVHTSTCRRHQWGWGDRGASRMICVDSRARLTPLAKSAPDHTNHRANPCMCAASGENLWFGFRKGMDRRPSRGATDQQITALAESNLATALTPSASCERSGAGSGLLHGERAPTRRALASDADALQGAAVRVADRPLQRLRIGPRPPLKLDLTVCLRAQ
jgi:hypothetical protein